MSDRRQARERLMPLCSLTGSSGLITDGDWVESKDQASDGEVRLLQLADISVGRFLDKSDRSLTIETANRLRCTFLEPDDVLIARMPDPIGRACIFPGSKRPCVTVVDVCILRCDRQLADPLYVSYMINGEGVQRNIERFIKGSTRQRISGKNLGQIPIPLPPLEKQRRIVAILDAADSLRAKRRAALAKLHQLAQSIFIDMFGDPQCHHWPMATVADVAASKAGSIRTGPFGSQLLHSEFVDQGIAVLGIDNCVTNEFRWAERRFVTEQKYGELKRYTVKPGDVLITIMGTCGRCAIVPDEMPAAINTKHLCCITLDLAKCTPEYLHAYFLLHPIASRYLGQSAKGAIMSGLNMGIIKDLPIVIPPLSLQRKFAAYRASIDSIKRQFEVGDARLTALLDSLQRSAFQGEL